MSDFGLFEAAADAEQEPSRKHRIAARKMAAALADVHAKFGSFMTNADGVDNFEDRFSMSRRDIAKIMVAHGVGAYPAVMREVHGSLKSAWYEKRAEFDEDAGDSEESNFTDGDDSGSDKPGDKEARRKVAEDRDAPIQDIQETYAPSSGNLIPEGDFEGYLDDVDQGGPEAVSGHDFTPGGDSGADAPRREAMQLVADLYTDWAQSNGLRVASMNTLDVYAANGLHDDDYYLLASLIHKAECECDEDKDKSDSDDSDDKSDDSDSGSSDSDSDTDTDTDGPEGPDTDTDGPPAGAAEKGGETSDEDGSEDDSNPFGGEGDTAESGDAEDEAPEEGGEDFPADPNGLEDAGPQDAPVDDGSAGGQEFTVPEQAPELPQDEMSQLQDSGPQSVPPEVIDDILGLPPGTLEQLIAEELGQAGGGAPPQGPPPQLARRRRQAAEDPTGAAESADQGDAAAAAAPAAAGAGSAGAIPPPGSASVAPPPAPAPLENQPAEDALLDTAVQSVTQMIDRETQEYQQIIDPLTQALQAIEFAQQVEQAENPLDVTPPEGTVDATPAAAPGGANSLQQQASHARRMMARTAGIAKQFGLTKRAEAMMIDAMSRKHYEHVAEAIRMVPPEMRGPVAEHIGAMFREDNPRFNHDLWMQHVAGRTAGRWNTPPGGTPWLDATPASRRPFVVSRTAGETWKNTPTMDAFEFPGHGETPEISDNMKINDLPKAKSAALDVEAKGVLDMFDDFTKKRTEKGLNLGPAANVETFKQEKGDKVGPKALDKLEKTIEANRKAASFFTRKVPGWQWNDHLAGYVSKEARAFICSCGAEIETPSYTMCHCGKIWNSYAIGDGHHLASDSAEQFITREIPVRKDVVLANRQMQAWTSDSGWTPPDQRDVDWVEDEDREDADAPHAPGKTAGAFGNDHKFPGWVQSLHPEGRHPDDMDDNEYAEWSHAWATAGDDYRNKYQPPSAPAPGKTAGAFDTYMNGLSQLPEFDEWAMGSDHVPAPESTPAPPAPAPAPSLKDRVRQHLIDRMNRTGPPGGFAGGRSAKLKDEDYIVKYTDDEDPARRSGPKKPPSTTIKGGDQKWHSRADDGKFQSTSPFGK
ncbi:hypothetical protein BI081_gp258 [Mycobacterium phage Tonenili]|uniref:Uncharacterized protein n=1 Tax=Mycobacterium phage Tonenili TaxID=1891703 RepID=A0A1C9EH79_9CAUD|nr:hypothetical protein BI081_gp258 [Mycobacterium phage Tonenili]AON96849.1 hypothetical protein SEA_TONENILI_102 [Mycobacterium phage Tonenili]